MSTVVTILFFSCQVLRKMINEKIKQLEDNYNEIVIPNLEKKIKSLESENNYLHEHAKRLQEMLTKLAIEHQKQQKQVCNKNFTTLFKLWRDVFFHIIIFPLFKLFFSYYNFPYIN